MLKMKYFLKTRLLSYLWWVILILFASLMKRSGTVVTSNDCLLTCPIYLPNLKTMVCLNEERAKRTFQVLKLYVHVSESFLERKANCLLGSLIRYIQICIVVQCNRIRYCHVHEQWILNLNTNKISGVLSCYQYSTVLLITLSIECTH